MAEAELIGVLCLGLSLLGLGPKDVVVKVSDRCWWDTFLEKHGVGEKERPTVLRTLDRLEGATAEQRREKLGSLEWLELSVASLLMWGVVGWKLEWKGLNEQDLARQSPKGG